MKALECVVLVLVLLIIWKCCLCKQPESFGTAPQPYTPKIQTPAWMTLSPMLGFEDSSTPARSQTLLRRLGMDNAGEGAAAPVKENFGYLSRWRNDNNIGTFYQIRT